MDEAEGLDEALDQLIEQGFSVVEASGALVDGGGNVQKALEILQRHGGDDDGDSKVEQQKAEKKKKKKSKGKSPQLAPAEPPQDELSEDETCKKKNRRKKGKTPTLAPAEPPEQLQGDAIGRGLGSLALGLLA